MKNVTIYIIPLLGILFIHPCLASNVDQPIHGVASRGNTTPVQMGSNELSSKIEESKARFNKSLNQRKLIEATISLEIHTFAINFAKDHYHNLNPALPDPQGLSGWIAMYLKNEEKAKSLGDDITSILPRITVQNYREVLILEIARLMLKAYCFSQDANPTINIGNDYLEHTFSTVYHLSSDLAHFGELCRKENAFFLELTRIQNSMDH
jgi:hypothetical protein